MADETVITESTPVPEASEAPKPIKDLKDYTPEETLEWRKTGKIYEDQQAEKEAAEKSKLDEQVSTEADSSTADSKSEPKAEDASESDPDSKKAPKKGKTAEDRKAQLAAEIQELLEQRRKLREEVKQEPKSEPKQDAKQDPSPEAKTERPVKPKIDDFQTYEEYENARDAYFEDLADWKADQKLKGFREEQAKSAEEKQQQSAQQERLEKWNKSIREAKQEWPDFEAVVHDLKPTAEVMEFLEDSDYRAQILYRLGEDTDNADRIFGLSKAAQLREIVDLEREFLSGSKKTEPKKEPTPISKAPKPPVNLRGGSSPGDPELAAVSANDYVAFERAANAKEMARRRGA